MSGGGAQPGGRDGWHVASLSGGCGGRPVETGSGLRRPVSPVPSVTSVTGTPDRAISCPRGTVGAWPTARDRTPRVVTSPTSTGSTAPSARASAGVARLPPTGSDDATRVQPAQPRGGSGGVGRAGGRSPRDPEPTQMLPTVNRPPGRLVGPVVGLRRRAVPGAAAAVAGRRRTRRTRRSRRTRPRPARRAPAVRPPPRTPPDPVGLGQGGARAVGGVPGRRAADRVGAGRQGRRDAAGQPPRRAGRHDVPAGRQRQPRGAHPQAAAGVRRRQGRGPSHRHDHAAAHRLRAQHADVDPAGLARAGARPRHDEDQLGVRVRRPPAARGHHREQHRHPDRRLRRDRLRRVRRRRRRGRRRADLPQAADEGQAREPRHQEGLPGRRRHRRAGLRPLPAHLRARRHRPGAAPARGGQRGRLEGRVAVVGAQPGPLLPARDGRLEVAAGRRRTPACSRRCGSRGR